MWSIVDTVGQKSDDPLSPAYISSIFSFTPHPKKKKVRTGYERYEAAKLRQVEKDRIEGASNLLALAG